MVPNAPVTLKAISRDLGISISTVSRALSGQGDKYRISKKTQHEIRDFARRVGFSPNPIARGLRLKKTATIGLLIPDISNPFFARIAHSITVAADEQQYSVLLADSQEQTDREAKSIDTLSQRQADGMILCPVGIEAEHLHGLKEASFPTVLVDRIFPELEMPSVMSDNAGGAHAATRLLIEKGHSRIGVLQGIHATITNSDRLDGYRRALAEVEIPFRKSLVAGDSFQEASGYQAAKRLMTIKNPPTALFALGNLIALGAIMAIRELGLGIPGNVSLVAFDDDPYAAHLLTPTTTVAQDVDALGRAAADTLFSLIHDSTEFGHTQVIATRLIQRESVGAPSC